MVYQIDWFSSSRNQIADFYFILYLAMLACDVTCELL